MHTACSFWFRGSSLPKLLLTILILCAATAIPLPAQSFTTITRFNLSDGLQPDSLTLGADGNLYGTTQLGGNLNTCSGYGCGTIFKVTPAGVLTTLYSFNGVDGIGPERLVLGSDGNFYGMTFCSLSQEREQSPRTDRKLRIGDPIRGAYLVCSGPASVFRISPSGMLVFLHRFNGADGAAPSGALVQGSDGNFYGTAEAGGANNDGTVFTMTPSGVLTVLYNFAGADGWAPQGGLVQATDGNFYGMTAEGGASNLCSGGCGTVFKITPSGTLTTRSTFSRRRRRRQARARAWVRGARSGSRKTAPAMASR